MVGLDDEIFVVSSGGVTIRMPVRDISSQGRDATGVRVMNLDEGQTRGRGRADRRRQRRRLAQTLSRRPPALTSPHRWSS